MYFGPQPLNKISKEKKNKSEYKQKINMKGMGEEKCKDKGGEE